MPYGKGASQRLGSNLKVTLLVLGALLHATIVIVVADALLGALGTHLLFGELGCLLREPHPDRALVSKREREGAPLPRTSQRRAQVRGDVVPWPRGRLVVVTGSAVAWLKNTKHMTPIPNTTQTHDKSQNNDENITDS